MKRAIVVGASSGIGLEVARLLRQKGWTVGVAARRVERLAEFDVAEQIDVNDAEAGHRLVELAERLGGMDLYFHASGIGHQNRELQEDIELQTVETNGLGFTRMVGAAYRYMAGHGGGHIAVISSIAGTKGLGPAPAYSATKALQNTYIQSLEQLANSRRLNIRFTDIRPGFVATDLLGDDPYPMLLDKTDVARDIVSSIEKRRHVRVIDWRWRIVTWLWRRIPRFVWRRLSLTLAVLLSLTAGAKDYVITDFGAVSDTTVLSTEAIQRAVERCSEAGGGRVVVPAGMYKTGTLVLRSHVNLYLEQGATLYGSTRLEDYRPMKTDYVSLRTQTATVQLVYADGVEDVTISGYGAIDGRGRAFKKQTWNDEGITRPHLLRFVQSRDIRIEDVTLRNSGCWMQHYLACDRLQIRGIKVINRNNYNNDALDLDGCHDVVVTGMIADSDDDAITLKSTSPRLCENIRISDCVVSSHCNGVKLGTETNGGFRNISISGIVIKPSSDQSTQFFGAPSKIGTSAISLEIVDGGTMENVSLSDFTVEGTESPIFIRLANRGRGYKLRGGDGTLSGTGNDDTITELIPIDHVGTMRGLYLSRISVRNAGPVGCSITGLPGHSVEDVTLTDITIHHKGGVTQADLPKIDEALKDEKEREYPEATMWGTLPAKGFYVRHARHVSFQNVEVTTDEPDARPAFVRVDADKD
ncbi:MAG: SDR family NAD(P)-dependent oxidoreductase [Prevotella sp.]|nr:SDR family NAD(P)-dependent oxidoreductase [Prevotella sp.]